MPRPWDPGLAPLLARFGLRRPDQNPILFEDAVRPTFGVAQYPTALEGHGRLSAFWATVPANAISNSWILFGATGTDNQSGLWIRAIQIRTGTGAAAEFCTGNAPGVAFPALAAAGSSQLVCKFDEREDTTALAISTGHSATTLPGGFLLSDFPWSPTGERGFWWQGTRIGIVNPALNDTLEMMLWIEEPFSGVIRPQQS